MNPKRKTVLTTVRMTRFHYTDLVPICFFENQSFEGTILRDPCTGKRCLKTYDRKIGQHRLLIDVDNVVLLLHRDGMRVRITRTPEGLSVRQLK